MTAQDKNMLIESFARGRESSLIDLYIADGPTALREDLGLTEKQWRVIFDYLVFNFSLLSKCVASSSEFFLETYIKHGMAHVRDILDVNDFKYDGVWEMVFDFLAISSEGLHQHFVEHRDRYISTFRVRGGDFVRKVLGIWQDKYDEHWAKILDLLLHGFCDEMFDEQTFEQGLCIFNRMINSTRIHRPLAKSEIFRRGLV